MKKLGLIVLMTLLTIQTAQAQETAPNTLFTFTARGAYLLSPFEFQWMPDSDSFFFHLIANEGPALPVFQYFVQSRELQSLSGHPTDIVLPFEQAKIFSASFPVASLSPDGRFVIYTIHDEPCGEAPGCSPLLGIADLQTGVHTPIPKGSDVGYTVRWSADSSAFLIIDQGEFGGLGGVYYGQVVQNTGDSADLRLTLLNNYDAGSIGFVDISRDGERVLLREMADGYNTGLILWDVRSPASPVQFAARADGQLILPDEVVAGASFIPNDERYLLVVLYRGIVKYNLDSGESELIDPNINAQWVRWAYFSPDVRYVATYHADNQITLYPVDLAS